MSWLGSHRRAAARSTRQPSCFVEEGLSGKHALLADLTFDDFIKRNTHEH